MPTTISNNKAFVIPPQSPITVTCHVTRKGGNGLPLNPRGINSFEIAHLTQPRLKTTEALYTFDNPSAIEITIFKPINCCYLSLSCLLLTVIVSWSTVTTHTRIDRHENSTKKERRGRNIGFRRHLTSTTWHITNMPSQQLYNHRPGLTSWPSCFKHNLGHIYCTQFFQNFTLVKCHPLQANLAIRGLSIRGFAYPRSGFCS